MQNGHPRQSITDRVRETLLRQILSGELAPGMRLREMDIARSFETSQAPVREAFKELEARELVVTEAYRGTYVREITHRDMIEAYHVRAALEELAGEQAASRLKTQGQEMQAIAAASAAIPAEHAGYARADYELHHLILKASGNRLLLRSWEALAFETRIEALLNRIEIDFTRSLDEHRNIIAALEKGQGRTAGKLLRAHSLRFARLLDEAQRSSL